MAFLQLRFVNDPDAEDFINIGNSVGLGKTNSPNDVLVIQALLAIVFDVRGNSKLSKHRPGNRPVKVSNKLEKDTPTLIAAFQSVMLKRPKPQGFCDQAPPTASKQIDFNTLYKLWGNAAFIQIINGEVLLQRLQREHPSLQNLPRRASELVIGHWRYVQSKRKGEFALS